MKFTLSAVLLSAIPGALSADLEPRLRGPVPVVMASCCSGSNTDYNNGFNEGKEQATYYWTNKKWYNADCDRISEYDKMMGHYTDDHYNNKGYDKGDEQYWYKQGAAKGMEEQKTYYDKQCKNKKSNDHDYDHDYVSVSSCHTIGTNVASTIAESFYDDNRDICGSHAPLGNNFHNNKPVGEYGNTMECITIAEDDCKGTMDYQISIWCDAKYDDYSVLKKLKAKCYNEVKKEIGGNSMN